MWVSLGLANLLNSRQQVRNRTVIRRSPIGVRI
ncbi:hypothetical protein SAMN05216557_10616 [Sphingomonas carotinifaciens]|uniref:Uncharacterized protein n=1 Tax=Sphingomonas carotinifaciens TaxID=1166323 RepID=A0A1G7P0I5_9SPHN|nr:hypothetical protein [Sphingomonas carotinifaciens]SDF79805.1 hypothetical protein SAMN05216557_10616 [Sphingomonas carotinifaciens]